jgi:hypothetical protein
MEPSLKWAANPNITVVVKVYGLKATAQVHNNSETCIWFIVEASSYFVPIFVVRLYLTYHL